MCFRFLGDYDEADDCVQEVCIKVFRSLGTFRCESLLRKCEELGILLESTGTVPGAGDDLVTVDIVIQYRDAAH